MTDRELASAVYTVAMSILGDPTRAADVVQATFANAWQASHRFDPDRGRLVLRGVAAGRRR